jgi:hypothetical protein
MPVTQSELQKDYAINGNPADGILAAGRLRFLNDTITFVGDEGADDVIALLPNLPAGALVDAAKSSVIGVSQAGVTLDIGTTAEADAYGDGVSIASAGTRFFDTDGSVLVEVAAGADLIATVKAGSPSAGQQRVSIAYYVR